MHANTSRIRMLNDQFRRTFVGGVVTVTSAVNSLPALTRARLLYIVRTFNAFDSDNDPHCEHDFGSVEVESERYFFKIDYYDRELENGSPDPSDTSLTTRVLVVMRADEY